MTKWMQKYIAGCKGYALYVNPRIWLKNNAISKVKRQLAYDTDYGNFSYSNEKNPFYNLVQTDLKQLNFLQKVKSNYVWRGNHNFILMPKHYHYFISSKNYSKLTYLTY